MEFGKRHDTTDTTDVCPRQLVTDLFTLPTCYEENFGLNKALKHHEQLYILGTVDTVQNEQIVYKSNPIHCYFRHKPMEHKNTENKKNVKSKKVKSTATQL